MCSMLFFGTCNTLVMKWQDQTEAETPVTDDTGKVIDKKEFNHPFFQCANMFVGEFMCLVVYFIKGRFAKKTDDNGEEVPLSPGGQQAQ